MNNENPIIFLDIDGVLNSELYFRYGKKDALAQIDPAAVELLNRIVDKTDAKVVLSSTWRLVPGLMETEALLLEAGFHGLVLGSTDDLNGENASCRGNEIAKWIDDNTTFTGAVYSGAYRRYVILDDDDDMLYQQRFNFIRTDYYCGLSPTNVTQAIKILNADVRSIS